MELRYNNTMNLNLDTTQFTKVSDIVVPDIFYRRMKTGVDEIDELFGNGILPGSSFTVTARAGCGKTTFLLQLFEALSKNGYDVGYASGEENTFQLAFNCRRLGVDNVKVANLTDVDTLVEATKHYDALVVDSFQALTTKEEKNSRELESYAITKLVNAAKLNECAIFFILHLTKGGVLKESRLLRIVSVRAMSSLVCLLRKVLYLPVNVLTLIKHLTRLNVLVRILKRFLP